MRSPTFDASLLLAGCRFDSLPIEEGVVRLEKILRISRLRRMQNIRERVVVKRLEEFYYKRHYWRSAHPLDKSIQIDFTMEIIRPA